MKNKIEINRKLVHFEFERIRQIRLIWLIRQIRQEKLWQIRQNRQIG